MATKRVLVIPHVGTAYGHLIRASALLETAYADCDVVVSVPESSLCVAKLHMPARVRFTTYRIRPTVTSSSGQLDIKGFLALLEADRRIAANTSPDLLIGDPGIRAGLLGERLGIPWVALTHGCYLPLPPTFRSESCAPGLRAHATAAWACATRALDYLIVVGSEGRITTWSELRSRGEILIPNTPDAEPCEIGTHIGLTYPRQGFLKGHPVPCLLTLCSSGDIEPDESALREIVARWGGVSVVGAADGPAVAGVEYLGSNVATRSLVGEETVVITHGGHGTLKALRGAARIVAVPGDLDQLSNSLVASAYSRVELAIGQSWLQRIKGGAPFRRYVDWGELIDFLQADRPLSVHSAANSSTSTSRYLSVS